MQIASGSHAAGSTTTVETTAVRKPTTPVQPLQPTAKTPPAVAAATLSEVGVRPPTNSAQKQGKHGRRT
jgi:hypothetical protein